MSKFELITTTKLNGTIPVHKYRSDRTGLTVVLGEVEGPVVNGYFTLATESHDDDGLPHTLEHLIFLGSEKYPYKGVLDLLANRCLASGTNAWTDTDHTCYTMTTAGSEGFLALLPIYLDHILYPTLTESAFTTEVHHISGDGEDGGVVYCEMQGRENTGESRAHLELLRSIYPNCGYSAETGGILYNLRTSTTNKKIKEYHAAFYRPENLYVIITGKVDKDDVFAALQTVEESIVKHGALPPFERPWQTPVPPLTKSVNTKILYPSDEEDCGLVNIGWRGPKASTEDLLLTANNILLRYLSVTSVSPLYREFIEIDDPYASKLSCDIMENSESLLYISFNNVPIKKVDLVFDKLMSVLKNISDGGEKIDMVRMRNVIDKQIMESLSSLENQPHDAVTFLVIGNVLYGNDTNDFDVRLNNIKQLEFLRDQAEEYWIKLLRKYMVDSNYVVVRAVPSIEEQKRMAKEELDRIEKQRNDLGPQGLSKKGDYLLEAMEKNETPPPIEMLTQLPVPSTEGINFHSVKIYRANDGINPAGITLEVLPVYAEAYDVRTNFIYMIASLNTDEVKPSLRSYLLIMLELLMESPVRRGNELIPYETVVAALESDTVSSGTRLGLESTMNFSCGPFSHTASMMLQVEPSKYQKGVNWLIDLLKSTEFNVDRIRVCAAKMVNDVAQAKRVGNSVAKDLLKSMYYIDESNVRLNSMLKQHKFLSGVLERLDNPEQAKTVIEDLNTIREIITRPTNMAIHLAADFEKIAAQGIDLMEPWNRLGEKDVRSDSLVVIPDSSIIKPEGIYESCGAIVGMGCVESAFLYQASPAINNFMDPDLPALLLFLQYLCQLEGPLWRQIRGQGLAYGYAIIPQPNEGLLYLTLYRATNVVAAYKETKAIAESQIKEDAIWDETLLESARSSLIFEIIEREKSVGDLVVQSLLSSFKKVPISYNRTMVERIPQVTESDLARVGKKYVAPLFTKTARTAIICHPDRVAEIATGFEQLGQKLTVETSLDESFLGKC